MTPVGEPGAEFGGGLRAAKGSLRVLHDMYSARIAYFDAAIRSRFLDRPCSAARVLDIGCGGQVGAALAQVGYDVTSVDLTAGAGQAPESTVDRRPGSAYDLPFADRAADVVVVSDVLAQLRDVPAGIAQITRVLRPGGLLLFDAINRTVRSYLVTILLAERVLRVRRPGTHDWRMFIRPGELRAALAEHGIVLAEIRGLMPARPPHRLIGSVLRGRGLAEFELNNSVGVGYVGHGVKEPARFSAVR
ncbi:bifunctional 2-polyprenyl-6-hydroxyphenol methylase/3-demethylubiquinol 3-O-methyltransferase UbiG [Actinokineospora iranica]|uniref:3-demethylubiquinone-9 3-methyltransferase n=1 Tax=Actinokineospora iranica TaxID=1271860 RepID=A0A1G6Z1B0_9PSEU|nr:bifunctional 2-polyprenyl-6-hydroxyphenol methylase/3-demethylubiquinol 3-O-methyltransferase UbiG [Actinokineospora iranica]SDD96534.1 3-demethylubiquinone-9 3-methyltransferase [Actinokineospora iranica]